MKIKYSFIAMIFIVATSNYLVQFAINDWLTWGAFSYPISFLVTELTVRFHGSKIARYNIYAGFVIGVVLSLYFATPKIAIASGTAFLVAQILDVLIFNHLRALSLKSTWWTAPLFASLAASTLDSFIFWTLAFLGENMPILTLALGDTAIKIIVDLSMLAPFRFMIKRSNLAA